ncbi:MAG: hypothetical protein IPL71_22075 [Anaerolineales bacterium]|uniref:hypothetical protein n=1 Tax=Candidatus Villigracilis proximus TaxID=3140683 RepID=UPI00313642E8|nr:hypothetical protein [Anaerolineales bacterium]
MDQNFREIQQRVRRYWFKDGIGEIVVGSLFLLLALYFAGHRWLPADSNAPMMLDGSLLLILILGIFTTRRLINIFKMHITYPRTGYVEYYPDKEGLLPTQIFIFFIAIGFIFLLVVFGKWVGSFIWLPGFIGALISIILIVIRTRAIDLNRFYYLAAASLFLGLASSFSGLPAHYSISLFYALFGIVLMIWGGATLAKYLHENPLVDEGTDER